MVVAAGALAGASAALATVPIASEKRDARVRVAKCSRVHHAAAFYSRMRKITGAEHMWMRFRVLERLGTPRFEPVRAPGLGRWRKSRPGVLAFSFRQRVRGLAEGADYRARVDYRWLDANGEVIQRARRRSGTCRQHGRLPNLQVLGISTRPTLTTGTSEYAVQVWNSGRAAALETSVDLFVDHAAVDRQTVSSVGPGEIVRVGFVGPSCERYDSPVAAVVDSDGTVLESREDDNRRDARCGDIAP
jgi:CARDB